MGSRLVEADAISHCKKNAGADANSSPV